jgi:hypothetical protein
MTKLEPLHLHKLKDREDIIAYIANKEDVADPLMPPTPYFRAKKLRLSEVVKAAMRYDVYKWTLSFLP